MKMLVTRDTHGQVINIGPWDEQCEPLFRTKKDRDGHTAVVEPLEVIGYGEPRNPLPAGATQAEEEVVKGWDGGLYAAGDPRAEKR